MELEFTTASSMAEGPILVTKIAGYRWHGDANPMGDRFWMPCPVDLGEQEMGTADGYGQGLEDSSYIDDEKAECLIFPAGTVCVEDECAGQDKGSHHAAPIGENDSHRIRSKN